MNKETLRQEIHRLVDREERTGLLKGLKELLEKDLPTKEDFWDDLTEEQKSAIDEAIAQLDRGEGYSFKEIRQEIKDKHGF